MLHLDHSFKEGINFILSVTKVSAIDKVVVLLLPASKGVRELKWPQEVTGLLEVWSYGDDLMDKILNTNDVVTT